MVIFRVDCPAMELLNERVQYVTMGLKLHAIIFMPSTEVSLAINYAVKVYSFRYYLNVACMEKLYLRMQDMLGSNI